MKQKLLYLYFLIFAKLAKLYLYRHKSEVIWVTWSIWKTSSRMIIYEILKRNLLDKDIYTSPKNFNWELWLSLSILWIEKYTPNAIWVINTFFVALWTAFFWSKKYDVILLEYGIDHIREMDFLLKICKPDIGILTKVDRVHLSQFWKISTIAREKYKLLINSKSLAFVNSSDSFYREYEKDINSKRVYYSTNAKKSTNIWVKDYKLVELLDQVMANFHLEINHNTIEIDVNLIWEENAAYIGIWYHILDYLYDKYYEESFSRDSKYQLLNLTLQPSRFSKFNGAHDSIIIDSTYNWAPESMKRVIDNFFMLKEAYYSDYDTILCIWEMRELWDRTEAEHIELAKYIKDKSENIFLIWEQTKNYIRPNIKKSRSFKNSKILWWYLRDFLEINKQNKYMILLKWSQNTIFLEEAIKPILKNQDDAKLLCRQEQFWIDKKEKFFSENS